MLIFVDMDVTSRERITQEVAVVRLELAKNVYPVHRADAARVVVMLKQLRRSQVLPFFEGLSPCLLGLEACASTHRGGLTARA